MMADTYPEPPHYYEQFLLHLTAIEKHTLLMSKDIPAELAKLHTEIADVYKDAGASRPKPGKLWGIDSGWSSLNPIEEAGARARRQLSQAPSQEDVYEAEIEGYNSPSPNIREGTGWKNRRRPGLWGNVLPLPRYPGAEPNTKDLIDYAATTMANLAAKQQEKYDREAKQKQQEILDRAISGDPSLAGKAHEDLPPELKAELEAVPVQQTKLGKYSDMLAGAENAYTQGRYVRGILNKVIRPFSPMSPMREKGYELGTSAGGAGPFGMHLPWNDPALTRGLEERMQKVGSMFSDNLSWLQVNKIYDQLDAKGWMNGYQARQMRAGASHMMNINPYIASMPQYYDMLDKSTRLGTQSIKDFNDEMAKVPDTAKAANVTIQQTMSDMEALGQLNKQQGGTYAQGTQDAQFLQSASGLPAGIFTQFLQNPMVKAQTFLGTGLPPYAQGLATAPQRMQAIMNSLNLYNRTLNPSGHRSYLGNTGTYSDVSKQDMKEAWMSNQFGVPKQVIHTLLAEQSGIMAGTEIVQEGQNLASMFKNDVQQKTKQGDAAAWNLILGRGKGTNNNFEKDLRNARDAEGHPIMEDWGYYKQLRDGGMKDKHKAGILAQERAMHDWKYAGMTEVLDYMQKHGPPTQHWDKKTGALVRDSGWAEHEKAIGHGSKEQMYWDAIQSGKLDRQTQIDVEKAKAKKVNDYNTMNINKFGPKSQGNGPSLTIELGPAAKKVLHLSSPTDMAKAANNAGSADIPLNASFGGGASSTPWPGFDTAGGSGTYSPGSQYDTSAGS